MIIINDKFNSCQFEKNHKEPMLELRLERGLETVTFEKKNKHPFKRILLFFLKIYSQPTNRQASFCFEIKCEEEANFLSFYV